MCPIVRLQESHRLTGSLFIFLDRGIETGQPRNEGMLVMKHIWFPFPQVWLSFGREYSVYLRNVRKPANIHLLEAEISDIFELKNYSIIKIVSDTIFVG